MFFFVLGIIALVTVFFIPKTEGSAVVQHARSALTPVGIALVGLGLLAEGFVTVPAGYRGLLLQFGAVHGDLSSGPHFITPFVQSVVMVEVRTLKETADAAAASRDLQNVQTKVAINYHVDPSQVGALYARVGTDFAQRIIDPATQETVKAVVANYTAEELIVKRGEVKSQIDAALTQRLAAYNLIVEVGGVSLTNFDFSPEFNKAIEQKQVAQQTAEQQKYELQRAELAAQTEVATARGKAQASQIEAAALNAQGGSKVLARAWIDKWDGKLPLVSGGQGLIMNIQSVLQDAMKASSSGAATAR